VFDHVTIRVSDRAASERSYGPFVLDPDGNNVELVNHNRG
jgi:catechol 2,3-dioxygenase-like lactoylglutathione lyase family enzyme